MFKSFDFPSFEPPVARLQLRPSIMTRFRLIDVLVSVALVGALLLAGSTPARSQGTSTIFLTDKNGQIPFPILPPNRATGAAGSIDNMTIGATTKRPGTFTTLTADSIVAPAPTCTATPCVYNGLAAAQGGSIQLKGGTSSTTGNAGGASSILGGTPGATGVGGAAAVTGAAGGATSGAGGAATLTGGAGTAGNSLGGVATVRGGAGQGTAAGAAASLIGGASGAGATGNGAAANVTGGAALSTNGSGGSVVLTGGVKTGSGIAGGVRAESVFIKQVSAPAALTVSGTLTGAQVAGGMITVTQGAGADSAQQMPTGTDLQAALPADFAVGDSIDLVVINLGGALETATLTVNTDVTIVGRAIVDVAAATASGSGLFRIRKTADHVFVVYRIS